MPNYKRTPEDRLTSLHDDFLISILSFLPIKQCVALSAVCSCFRRRLPSLIPRLDTFRLDVEHPSDGVDIVQQFTFPRSLIRQCHIVFRDVAYLSTPLRWLLVEDLVEAGVQDLIIEATGKVLNLNGRDSGLFGIKALRSLSLYRIRVSKYSDRRPLSPLGCTLLASLKMECCFLRYDLLRNLLASCPFLETLQLIFCFGLEQGMSRVSIHSASIKHLVLLLSMMHGINAIDVQGPKLESLAVDVVNELRIEAPKVLNASFLLAFMHPKDPSVALMNFFRAPFPKGIPRLMLNSSTAPKVRGDQGLAGIDEFICPAVKERCMIFNLDFNVKDQSSTMILTELLEKCNNCNTKFDIRTYSRHMESTTETARDDEHLLHGLTGSELIKLRMTMSERRFEGFLSNRKKMKKLKHTGLEILRRRTGREQFMNILASDESLFQVSSNIANCIEMKF